MTGYDSFAAWEQDNQAMQKNAALSAAVDQAADRALEIQIDEIGYDSQTNTAGHPEKRTGAIYNLQAPTGFPSNPIGQWNTYIIEATGARIAVTLNGQLINQIQSTRQPTGYIALQAHHLTSRVQFRNLQLQKLLG